MKRNSDLILQHLLWRALYFFSVLLINIGIARFFAAEKSGQIFYIINNLALILLLVSISLESGSAFYVASGNLDPYLMARFCGFWATVASLVALGIWWIIMYLSRSEYLTEPGFLVASLLFILGVLFTTYFTALFYAKKEFRLPNKILSVVNMLLIVLLVVGRNNSIIKTYFIQIYFSCFFIQGWLLRVFFFRKYTYTGERMFPPGSILKLVIRYSLAALLANGIYFLVNRIDYWFVQFYCTPKDLGNYIQASKLGQMMLILPSILGSTLFPIFSSQNKSRNTTELTSVMRVLLWINGFFCLLIIGLGWFLFPLVFGVSFNSMYLLFVLLIPGILSFTMNYPLAAWFSAGNRIGINIRGSLLALVVIFAGDLLILPKAGILSAPIISSAGYFCYYCYTVYIYRREYSVPWKDFLFIRKSDINRIRRLVRTKLLTSPRENPMAPNQTI